MEGLVWPASRASLGPLDADRRENVEDGLSGHWCGDPDERAFGVEPAVEVEDETVCREEKRQAARSGSVGGRGFRSRP